VLAWRSLKLKLPHCIRLMKPLASSSCSAFDAVSFAIFTSLAASRTDSEISPLLNPLKRRASST
jgi:hypothetical protein